MHIPDLWGARWRFVAVMAGFVAAVLLLYRESIIGPLFIPLRVLTARMTLAVLHLVGMDGVRIGTVLYHPDGFGYQISHGCTGFLPAAFLAVGMLAYPASARHRAIGIAVGIPLLGALNLFRLVHLYVIGVVAPAWFDVAHEVVWDAVVVCAIFFVWLGWTFWADRHRPAASAPNLGDVPRRVVELETAGPGIETGRVTPSLGRPRTAG